MVISHKNCIGCLEEKEISEFSKQAGNADGTGYRSYCRSCYKGMRKKYYDKDKEGNIERARKTRKRLEYEFQVLKSKLKCKECGESDSRCLDFHHIEPEDKLKSVREAFFKNGKKAAQEEADKCEILCANCHRKHHGTIYITDQDVSDRYPSIGEFI